MSDVRSPETSPEQPAADIRDALLARLKTRCGHDRYSDRQELAQGGQGQILQVWDEDLRRALAMKVVHGPGDPRAEDSSAFDRFLEEAQITGQLDHPGIVPVHELGVDAAGRLYFTMRLVKGQDLKQVFDLVHAGQEGWSVTRALSVMLKVCEAMAYAHRKGVIHRDLKPRNVMVGRFGEVYVMDWGLARVLGHPDGHDLRPRPEDTLLVESDRHDLGSEELVTMDGSVIGTPAYMCPEQARGFVADLDARADVYSSGAMLYHLLAGQPPFVPRGAKLSARQVLWRVIEGPPERVHQLAPRTPAELVAICEKAMARDPERRYRDMAELAQDLSAYLEHRVVAAYQTGAIAELSKWVSRNRALAAALAAALLASLGGMAVALVLKAQSDRHAVQAEQQGRLARQRQDDVFRLSAFQRLADMKRAADELWPASPARLGDFESWLARAAELVAGLEPDAEEGYLGHRAKLAELEASAAAGPTGDALAEDDLAWWRSQLARLVAELEVFADPDTGLIGGLSAEFGWGVARRKAFAASIEERSISGAAARAAWAEAIDSIADREACPLYAGLRIRPQPGLLPIGRAPRSSLWEFAHLMSGEPAERRGDGELELSEETGIALVLLPGGTFQMGAQTRDPDAPNYDPRADPREGPVREVTLSPFFLAKYEVTQSQWLRFTGKNPSRDNPRTYETFWSADGLPWDLLHPVEMVSWNDCVRLCSRMELALPSEAQWEYAARGGTSTPWWTGADPRSLDGAANLCDRYAKEHGGTLASYDLWLDDGHTSHARVGLFAPNPFGLFDVLGNVWEWCRDGLHPGAAGPATDPVGDPGTSNTRVGRGGGFDSDSAMARSSFRGDASPEFADFWLGLRPARPLER